MLTIHGRTTRHRSSFFCVLERPLNFAGSFGYRTCSRQYGVCCILPVPATRYPLHRTLVTSRTCRQVLLIFRQSHVLHRGTTNLYPFRTSSVWSILLAACSEVSPRRIFVSLPRKTEAAGHRLVLNPCTELSQDISEITHQHTSPCRTPFRLSRGFFFFHFVFFFHISLRHVPNELSIRAFRVFRSVGLLVALFYPFNCFSACYWYWVTIGVDYL